MKGRINNRILYIVLPICFTFVTALILVLTCLCSHLLPNIYKMPTIENAHLDMTDREDWVVLPGEWEYYYEKWIITDNIADAQPDGMLSMPDVWTGKVTKSGQKLPRTGYGSFRLIVENVESGLEVLVFANNYDGAYRTYINGVLNVEYGVMSKDAKGTKSNGRAENYYPYKVAEGETLDVVVEISDNNEGGMHYAFYLRSDFKTNQIMIGDQLSMVVLGIMLAMLLVNVSGKISDERFAKMTATYEAEQNGLQQTAQRLKDEISAVREEGESVDRFMKLVNKYSDITELNAEIIRTFVEKIIVYEAEKIDGVKTQRVKIVYNCVGTVSVPNADNEPVKTDKTKIIEVA